MTRYVNTCKIPITLLSRQFLNPKPILDYNTINLLDLPSDNKEEDINPKALKNGKEGIRLADMDNDTKDIGPADIDKEKPTTPN